MNQRVKYLIDHLGLSASKFADQIGVQRSAISHIIAGRNKPSFDVITNIITQFKDINERWLLLGEGNMLKTEHSKADLFTQPNKQGIKEEEQSANTHSRDTGVKATQTITDTNVNNVKSIVIIYKDSTFEILNPRV
ncbi:MAG: helix-turn-helix transcriptional regulator [Bacteroidales bacterium]|nr:helix-turn-helix transcriptional regulator [Bacteroidales bacterium]